MGFEDRSQYMLVAAPLAVRMLSWMWQTQWPFSVCWRRMQPLARLQTSCSESQPNQFFYVLPSKQTSICVAYRKHWPQLLGVCGPHKAAENEQHPWTDWLFFSFYKWFCQSKWENYHRLKRKTNRTCYVPAVKFPRLRGGAAALFVFLKACGLTRRCHANALSVLSH